MQTLKIKRQNEIHGGTSSPMSYRKTLFVSLFICLFLSLNILATTNNVAADYKSQINQVMIQFESQWDILCANADKFSTSIKINENAHALFNELIKRTENKQDQLNHLNKYEPIFSLGGAPPLVIYNKAYELAWKKEEDRSAKLFKFLINDNNQNKFTIGNSHYWLARHLYFVQKDRTNALNHYLRVHKYPSCLVFTDAAYCRAGRIYNELGKPDIAIALYSIQIPHIDHWRREVLKADQSFQIAIQQEDYSNAIYQVERKNIAFAVTKSTNKFNSLRWERNIENTIIKNMRAKAKNKNMCCSFNYT